MGFNAVIGFSNIRTYVLEFVLVSIAWEDCSWFEAGGELQSCLKVA